MFATSLWRRAGTEFVGTYALVTAGCGAIIVNALQVHWPTLGGLHLWSDHYRDDRGCRPRLKRGPQHNRETK